MTSILRFLFVTGCMVQLLVVSSAFILTDRKPRAGVTGYCFRQRNPIGKRGRCTDKIHPPVRVTLSGAADCCSLGGVGWSIKTNGKRCEDACKAEPDRKDVQPLESSVTLKDEVNFHNDSNNTAKVMWSVWSDWQNCTASCGVGNMTRYRTCNGGGHCNGSSEETITCNSTLSCQDIGNATWSAWSDWQNCTASCGVGNMTRYRTCNGGDCCNGSSEETVPCNNSMNCQDIGNSTWSAWGDWQNCTASCGVGNMTRYRTCNGGDRCNGSSEETVPCNNSMNCQDYGNSTWSAWGDWQNCTASCGVGNMTRYRTCNGGGNCNGSSEETIQCDNKITCQDLNDGWTEWSSWTPCSGQCGVEGFSLRSRMCKPQQSCTGSYIDVKTCTTDCTR